jgi:ribosomal protein L29
LNLKEDEASTKYLYAKANGSHRRNTIVSLDHGGGNFFGQKNLEKHINKVHQEYFGQLQVSNIHLNLEDIPHIKHEIARSMTYFSMDKIKLGASGMARNKSSADQKKISRN